MTREAAEHRVAERMGLLACDCDPSLSLRPELPETQDEHEAVGTAWGAAASSFCFFASGADRPDPALHLRHDRHLPPSCSPPCWWAWRCCHRRGRGLLSGTSPTNRGLRQLAIGLGAAGVTYVLGMAFGAVVA